MIPKCINLITVKVNKDTQYCLAYHDFVACPERCPMFKSGTTHDMNELIEKGFYPLCKHFDILIIDGLEVMTCSKYSLSDPDCYGLCEKDIKDLKLLESIELSEYIKRKWQQNLK